MLPAQDLPARNLHVYCKCALCFLSQESLRCLPSNVLSTGDTRGQMERIVRTGRGREERSRVMRAALFIGSHPCQCFVLISLWHFRGWGKKATKQCNGEKDLQRSTIEPREAWRIKQMPWLTLTVPCLSTYLCSPLCVSHVGEAESATVASATILHERRIIARAIYYAESSLISFSRASLSSVKSNEQMLLSCWSQYDGLSCWQTHPSAGRVWEGSSGRWTACRGALTLLYFSPLP